MDSSLSWTPEFLEPILALAISSIGFILYYFISQSKKINALFEKRWGLEVAKIRSIYFQRMCGVLFFGIVPVLVIWWILELPLENFGVALKNGKQTFWWTAGLGAVVVLMNAIAARKEDNLRQYPQIRASNWSKKLVFWSAISWAAYLLVYEFLFRGFLFFACFRAMGLWLAIAVNLAIYSLVHVPKGIKETVGAIPLGLVLCLLAFKTQTIWIAFFVHLAMALSNEWFSLHYHSEMKMEKGK